MNIANFCDYQIYHKSWMKERDCWIYFTHLVIVDKEHGHLHRTEHEGADRGPYSQPPDICQETVSLRNFVSFEMINGECI